MISETTFRPVNIGIDIHGVIDRYPHMFRLLTQAWTEAGHNIYILTGQEFESVSHKLENIIYSHFFSIVSCHKDKGTHMWDDDPRGGGWWMDPETWNRSKGEFAERVSLDIHFDNDIKYAPWFPESCSFVRVGDNFDSVYSTIRNIGV